MLSQVGDEDSLGVPGSRRQRGSRIALRLVVGADCLLD